jgi:hypothetical protein
MELSSTGIVCQCVTARVFQGLIDSELVLLWHSRVCTSNGSQVALSLSNSEPERHDECDYVIACQALEFEALAELVFSSCITPFLTNSELFFFVRDEIMLQHNMQLLAQ